MKELDVKKLSFVSGGIWCSQDGHHCTNCANKIWIAGNDCSILVNSIKINSAQFDYGSLAMTVAGSWVAFVASSAATYTFGFGVIASGGVGLACGIVIGTAYLLSQK